MYCIVLYYTVLYCIVLMNTTFEYLYCIDFYCYIMSHVNNLKNKSIEKVGYKRTK